MRAWKTKIVINIVPVHHLAIRHCLRMKIEKNMRKRLLYLDRECWIASDRNFNPSPRSCAIGGTWDNLLKDVDQNIRMPIPSSVLVEFHCTLFYSAIDRIQSPCDPCRCIAISLWHTCMRQRSLKLLAKCKLQMQMHTKKKNFFIKMYSDVEWNRIKTVNFTWLKLIGRNYEW